MRLTHVSHGEHQFLLQLHATWWSTVFVLTSLVSKFNNAAICGNMAEGWCARIDATEEPRLMVHRKNRTALTGHGT